MQLDKDIIDYFKKVVRTADLVGIENVVIEKDAIRAIDERKTVVIFHQDGIPTLPFESIGLNRIGLFTSRLQLAETRDKFAVEAVEKNGGKEITTLVMKGKGVKIDYRCANPQTIQAPKKVNDSLKFRVPLDPEAVMLLQKAHAAMPQLTGSEVVRVSGGKEGIHFELADSNHDVFSQLFATKAENLVDESPVEFAHRYPIKTLLSLFRHNPEGHFDIGEKGILNILINDINVFVIPQV